MYKYENFKDSFDKPDMCEYLIKVFSKVSKLNGNFTRVDVIQGICGDSWKMLAALDKLVELGYVRVVNTEHEVSNYWIYSYTGKI